ncbi:MAG: hypothetical protein K6T99_07525 [Armatimonadetes bacterium]|nr:hypothetical protein [Armatimonadota bacterium]
MAIVCAALLIYILGCVQTVAGTLTAKQILEKAAANYDAVRDYVVEAKIKVESSTIHVPETAVKIYFKKPNKLYVESKEGFAIIPKQGLLVGNPVREIMAASKLSLVGTEFVDGCRCHVVKASYEREGRSVDTTLWIDNRRWLILRINSNPDWGPSTRMQLQYTKVADKIWLPSRSYATIIIPPIPGSQAGKKPATQKPAVIYMSFSNYRVNTGLNDKIFEGKNGKR